LHPDAVYLVVGLARQINPGDVVFTGVNSAVPTAACLLAKRCYPFEFTHLNVAGGVDSRPDALPASSGDPTLLAGTAAIFNNEDFYDLCTRGGIDIAYLGSAQIDAEGRSNVSAIGSWHEPKVRLPGGGGAAVMMPTARRTVVWQTSHSPRGLVTEVDFATSAGARTLVTPLAVFDRPTSGRFVLTGYRDDQSVEGIRELTGFDFQADEAEPSPPPTADEIGALEALDPDGVLDRIVGRPRTHVSKSPT
jgi:glutaconate CoA-transferase subunit B